MALLTLAVLLGLVAMHGLAPGTAAPFTSSTAGHGSTPSAAAMGAQADGEHAHQGRGGHAEHADAQCAAGGVSTAPALGAPQLDVLPCALAGPSPARVLVDPGGGGRAPPSLSALQLLRI
ncbi:hypothetical protein D7319_00215 [Streptomyces radicis]|uniref:Secreted protein n=1 Tax=Streptomyces radicis TaxID=1750517 RepID=A0A3A9WYL1_9ACTN|nr:hypothetical protein D7319_00215 [Streptomyces radicis]RKN27894.1 hypothetical protein D7318_02675 [Streptomyces radicis]